jgi:hypothetical protein
MSSELLFKGLPYLTILVMLVTKHAKCNAVNVANFYNSWPYACICHRANMAYAPSLKHGLAGGFWGWGLCQLCFFGIFWWASVSGLGLSNPNWFNDYLFPTHLMHSFRHLEWQLSVYLVRCSSVVHYLSWKKFLVCKLLLKWIY